MNEFAHVGANSVLLPTDLAFDRILLSASVKAGSAAGTVSSLLPILGSPEQPFGSPVTYTIAAVPEPATWATTIVGVGFMGAAMRRRRGMARIAGAIA